MDSFTWCRACGKKYKVCPTCADVKTYTPWRTICCTAEHYKIWLIAEQYKKGIISIDSASEQLHTVLQKEDEVSVMIPAVQDILHDILDSGREQKDEVSVEQPKEVIHGSTKNKTNRKGRAK